MLTVYTDSYYKIDHLSEIQDGSGNLLSPAVLHV